MATQKESIHEKYDVLEEIGRGSFSVVKKGRRKSDKKCFALKVIQKKYIKVSLLEREIAIMKKLKHSNILPLVETYEDPDQIYLVLELATGGELFDKIVDRGHYSESEASLIVKQILEAVSYLHVEGVVHRDLKPENLLCSNDYEKTFRIFVADFGLSRLFEKNEEYNLTTYCGSPEYVAPEVLACGAMGTPYHASVDLWSVGVITYILLTGFLPFYDRNHMVLFEKIQNVDYTWDDCPVVTPSAKHFIEHLLVKDPSKRYTAAQALQHPWVKGEGVSKLRMSPSFSGIMKEYKQRKRSGSATTKKATPKA